MICADSRSTWCQGNESFKETQVSSRRLSLLMDDPKLKSKPASPSHSSDRALSSLLQSSHSPMSPSITAFDFTQTMAQGPHCPGLRTPMQTIEQKPAGPLIRLPYVSASCLAQNLRLSPHHPCPASLSCLGKYDFRPSLRGRPAILLLMCVCLSASRGGRVQAREEMLIHTAHESILWSGGRRSFKRYLQNPC